MTRLTMLFIAVALVLPGAAFAMPTNDVSGAQPQATEDLRAPDRDPGTVAAPARRSTSTASTRPPRTGRPQRWARTTRASARRSRCRPPSSSPRPVATDGNGLSWTLAIGGGIALMLAALGLGVYAGRTIHPRHIGA